MDTTFVLTAFKSWYRISVHESLEPITGNLKSLWINRSTCQIVESDQPMTKELALYDLDVDATLGIFHISGSSCLAVVTKSELVADVFLDQATCSGKDTSKIYVIKVAKCLSLEYDLVDPLSDESVRLSSNSPKKSSENDNFITRTSPSYSTTSWFSNIKLSTSKDYENNAFQGHLDLARSLQGLERLLSSGYYFSFDTDLTRSMQRLALGGHLPLPKTSLANFAEDNLLDTDDQANYTPSPTLWDVADKNFNWSHVLADKIPKHWVVPLIQGYVGYSITYESGSRVELMLIARRSVLRSGTRFCARGIDEYGNVANFTESEIRVRVDGNGWKSFVQIRGSVPVFWKQELLTSHPVIMRSSECTLEAFTRHVDILHKLCGQPGKVCCVNLLELKEAEQILTDAFCEQVKLRCSDNIELVNFNYASQTKWSHINTVLIKFISENLVKTMDEISYFDSQSMTKNIDDKDKPILQRGIFRINCLDCLDRTNGMQWMIAWVWLTRTIDPEGNLCLLTYKQEEDVLFQNFTELWCAHGDSISIHYAGTPSTLTEHVRQGRANLGSMIHFAKTMVDRAYTSIFEDCSRQEYFDIILGIQKQQSLQNLKKSQAFDVPSFIPTEVDQSELKIWCGSWNIGGNNISEDDDVYDWIGTKRVQSDIYMFCLQEFVELTAVNVVINKTDYSKELLFNNKVSNILTMYGSYSKVKSVSMIGLYLVVYAKESIKRHIYNVDVTNVKTGLNCNAGNKGAIGIKFNLYGHKIALINVHLNSGKTPQTGRMDLLQHVIHNAFQEKEYNSLSNQDLFIIGGDFNFQVQLDKSQTIELMRRMEYQRMLEYDEFKMGKMMGIHFLRHLQEANIDFQPTYKYKTGTQFYTFKRTPSWCDRIIYGGRSSNDKNIVRSLYYTRHDRFYSSDHKPVSSVIVLKLKKEHAESGNISVDEPLIEF